jgi:hypothetical protein
MLKVPLLEAWQPAGGLWAITAVAARAITAKDFMFRRSVGLMTR